MHEEEAPLVAGAKSFSECEYESPCSMFACCSRFALKKTRVAFPRDNLRCVTCKGAEPEEVGPGSGLVALHMPGHTPGSTSYYHDSSGFVFTGDAFFNLRVLSGFVPAFCHGMPRLVPPIPFSTPQPRRALQVS